MGTGKAVTATETVATDDRPSTDKKTPKDLDFERQKAPTRRRQKSMSTDTLTVPAGESQQSQPNMSSIQRARKFRNGEKRSQRELIEHIFATLRDGGWKSTSRIAKDSNTAWTSTYWNLSLIEFIQSQPHLERDPDPKRKRYYRLLAPAGRRR